jgi:signal transduction histidine kinase
LPSIKLKLSILIVAAVAVSAAMSQIGFRYGWPVWLRPIAAGCVSLLMVQFLAHGMTSPLREMAEAAKRMSRGDDTARITATSNDEVGQLARAFNSMASDLAELDAERRALVSNAAHELRTPIAGLHATMENLADGVIDPTPDVIERLVVQTERLRLLVADLLDLSRLEASSSAVMREPTDVVAVAEAAIERLGHEHPGIDVTCIATTTPRVYCNGDLIERMMSNLLRNAAVHGEGRDIAVRLSSDADHVLVAVSDAGPGFAGEDADHLFDRFYRGDVAGAAGRPGSGLGLAICRAIALQHGGSISATPNASQGAVFTVRLPITSHDRSSARSHP